MRVRSISKLHTRYTLPNQHSWWGISSDGRALALHARGTGIDTRILQRFSFLGYSKLIVIARGSKHFSCIHLTAEEISEYYKP